MLVAQSLEDALGGVALLRRSRLVILQDLADDSEKRAQLGSGTLLLLFIN